MKAEALALGFKHVESGPLVRSSYHARDQVPGAELKALRRPGDDRRRTAGSSRAQRRASRRPRRAALSLRPWSASSPGRSRWPSSTATSAARSRPAIMWSIAHAQGIALPTKDYWDFDELVTVTHARPPGFDGYLQLFHWTELIQSSPLAVERSVYEAIGGAYRKNNVTTLELRFNPMKRNRGGEHDLDHIIAAAIRGMDRATLEYPVTPA